jgi:hypothetical protein
MSINNTSINLFGKLQDNGFKVVGKYIYKRSETNNRLKVVGQVNENNLFFFSENVYPFKGGVNFLNENNLGENKSELKEYYTKVKENDRNDFKVSFEKYLDTTKENSIFINWLNNIKREYKSELTENYFDVRGVSNGYLEDSAVFPFFDFDNNFVTAQIIKYGKDGKRIKSDFSQNWFHSYKPIKKDLGFKDADKFSVSIPCFFGENYLNGSDNIVAIVEAPKSAVILKELYPNIDWIATAGEQTLFNKNLDVLRDKKVIIFPDAHTTKWNEFSKEKGFYCSNVLENKEIAPGDDLADHVFNSGSEIFSEIHELLFSLNLGEFDFEVCTDSLKLDYKVTGYKTNYFITVPIYYKGQKVINQLDNAQDFKIDFKGKKFDLYSDKYDLYTAQLDWHRPTIKKIDGKDIVVNTTEKDFIFKLQGCFRILKELNPKIYKGLFCEVIKNFRKSNFSFNKKYVLNRLLPFWDSFNRDLEVFKKQRNWKYKGNDSLDRTDFIKELNNHRFQYKSKLILEDFNEALSKNRYIDTTTDLWLTNSMRGYSKIRKLVSTWNEKVIGCKTLKTYFNKLEFKDKLNENVKSLPPYIKSLICSGTDFTFYNFSVNEAMMLTENKNNKAVKSFLTFKPNETTRKSIFDEVFYLLNNVTDIVPIRQKIGDTTRIHDFEIIERKAENSDALNFKLSPEDAFISISDLELINTSSYSDEALKAYNLERNYLNLLEFIKTFTHEEKEETFQNNINRIDIINKYLHPLASKENKFLQIA